MKTHYILPFIFFALFSLGLKAQTVPTFTISTIDASLDGASDVKLADLDGDGDIDVVAVGYFAHDIVWYENDGAKTPSFTKHFIDADISSARNVSIVDLDNDGDLDVIGTAYGIRGFNVGDNIFWYENDSATDPAFTKQVLGLVKGYAWDLAIDDLDGDGDLDVAISDHASTGSDGYSVESVTWFENDGASDPLFSKNLIDVTFRGAESIVIGDIDGDNDLDIVVGSNTQDDIVWYENNGAANPTFSKQFADQNALGVAEIALGDIDNDGDLDIIWSDSSSDYVAWLKNDGAVNPSFYEVRITNYNSGEGITVSDLDLDGDLDIVITSYLDEKVEWFESDGESSPTFTKHTLGTSLWGATSVAVDDINGDGSPDVVAAILKDEDIVWFESDKIVTKQGSIVFDGVDDMLTIDHNAVFNDLDSVTIEAWVYFNSSGRNGIIEKHNSPSSGYWIDFNTDISAIFVTENGEISKHTSINPQLNTWYHLAVSYDGTHIKIYLDGTDVSQGGSGSGSGQIQNNTNSINIGNFNWESSYLDGKIDEVRIWNTVVSENKIRENMYQKLSGSEDGLIGYWTFDEKTTSIALDLTSSNSTASLNNGVKRSKISHPYGTVITGNEGWRIMSVPVSGVSYGELLDTLWTQGFTGADATQGNSNVQIYNEATQSFSSIANASDIPSAGQGFIAYVYDDADFNGTSDGFPKHILTNSDQQAGEISPSLSFNDSDTLANDGWNLVGNPYGAAIDWNASSGLTSSNLDASFYVWSDSADSGNGDYLTWNGSTGTLANGKIAPWQGFWVKANTTNPTLSFTDEARSSGGIFLKENFVPTLTLTLNGSEHRSTTLVSLQPEASTTKDRLDAYKLQSLNPDNFLALFTQLEDGSGLDINALPPDLDELVDIPVGFEGTDLNGNFVLNWNLENLPSDWNFLLIDNITNEQINLQEQQTFSFALTEEVTAKTKDLASPQHRIFSPNIVKAKSAQSRFTLRVDPTGLSVSNESAAELPTTVELRQNYPNPFNPSTTIAFGLPQSGKVTLEVFDLLGRKVATLLNGQNKTAGRHTINFDASSLSSGMYIYRLQAGNSVMTKKLTLIK